MNYQKIRLKSSKKTNLPINHDKLDKLVQKFGWNFVLVCPNLTVYPNQIFIFKSDPQMSKFWHN
jgi:hypothetical protein